MKASELIAALQRGIELKGDVECLADGGDICGAVLEERVGGWMIDMGNIMYVNGGDILLAESEA